MAPRSDQCYACRAQLDRRVSLTLGRGRSLMHGVAPHKCGQVARPLLGGGAGGRSPGVLAAGWCGEAGVATIETPSQRSPPGSSPVARLTCKTRRRPGSASASEACRNRRLLNRRTRRFATYSTISEGRQLGRCRREVSQLGRHCSGATQVRTEASASHHFSAHGRSTTSNAQVDRCWRCSCR